MGEWEDLVNALNDFVDWADDFFELEREEEYDGDYPDEIPLRKDGTPDMRFKINKELFGEEEYIPSPEVLTGYEPKYADEVEEEEEEEEEKWYAYYWTIEGGYFGNQVLSDESGVFYADSDDREWDVFDRIIADFGVRYFGKGYEMDPSVDSPYEVDKEEVDDWEKLDQ